jgi:phthalate 4,5-cis-dihydrodiol dehydrogenase
MLTPGYRCASSAPAAVVAGAPPLHDGPWARSTLAVILALLQSAAEQRDVAFA